MISWAFAWEHLIIRNSKTVLGQYWCFCLPLPIPTLPCVHMHMCTYTHTHTHTEWAIILPHKTFRSSGEWQSFRKSPELSLSYKEFQCHKAFPALVSTYLPSLITTHLPTKRILVSNWFSNWFYLFKNSDQVPSAPSGRPGHLILLIALNTHA